MLQLLHTSESFTCQSVMKLLDFKNEAKSMVRDVLFGLKGIGLVTRARKKFRYVDMQWYWLQGTRTDCMKSNIGLAYLYIRANPGVFCTLDLAKVLNVNRRRIYDIFHILSGLSVLTKVGHGRYETATLLHSDPVLPWQQVLDDIWGDSNELTSTSHVNQSDSPECQVPCITSDCSMLKSDIKNEGLQPVSILVESNSTQMKSHESEVWSKDTTGLTFEDLPFDELMMDFLEGKVDCTDTDSLQWCMDTEDPRAESNENEVGCMDTTDLTFENFQLDEFMMDFLESKVDWIDTDSLREWLDMEPEGLFPFKEDAIYPTPQDIADIIDGLNTPL